VVTIDGGNVSGEKTLLEWAFPECGKLNLATQARFRKITVINKAEQERKQREQAEREQKARIAEQQRQEQERARIAEQQRQEQEQARIAEQQRQEQERARIAEQQRHEQGIYAIGETGPAGGIIFYDKGAKSDGWRYLEAAPASSEFEGRWNEAVENCKRMNINGIGGWRLPTVNELNYMYENLAQKGLGSFSKEYLETTYWSSSVSDGYVSSMDLDRGGETASRDTSYHYRVRAIRAF
jgi:flagellar biosynthesis GTPase FlhF